MNPTAALLLPEVTELLEAKQYGALREVLHAMPPADVADILAALEREPGAIAFRILPRDDAGEVFAYLAPQVQEGLIRQLGDRAALRVIEAMDVDDRARLLDELPTPVAQAIIASLSPQERTQTQAILGYPPRSVGRLMTPDYVRVRPDWTVARALEHVRRHGRDAETVNVVYVVNERGELIDDLRLRQIIMAEPEATVESLMNRQFIALRADQPQEEAVDALQKYDRVALPVVDTRGVLLGIVTHDDVADVAQQLATENIQKVGGMAALDAPYMQTGHGSMYRKRGPWLALLLVGQSATILVLGGFQQQLEKAVVLTLFLPLVISCGGNSGSQVSTLITRAMAVGEITPRDWAKVLRKELVGALMLGGTLAGLGLLCVGLFTFSGHAQTMYPMRLATTIALAVMAIVVWAVVLGSTLPLLLKRLGLDPATASAPMVATLMDASGTLIYLGLALAILSGTVLPG